MYAEKYQWIKGEKTGKVEQYTSHDNEWVYFVGGARISSTLIQEYMLQVDGNTPLDLNITTSNVQPAPVFERKVTPKKEEFNPIKSLLKKATPENVECSYTFNISLPKKSVYTLIKDSFDSDIDSLVLELIMAEIKPAELYKEVEKQIKEQILNFYIDGKQSRESGSNKKGTEAVDERSPEKKLS